MTQFTDWPTVSSETWRKPSGPRSNPSYCRIGLLPSSRAGAARQKTNKQCDGHERWGNLKLPVYPLNDFHACLDGQTCHRVSIILFFFLLRAKVFSPSLLYLLYWFNVRDREFSFYLGFAIPFTCVLFVDSRPSGGVSSSTPSLHSGSTLLTSRIHFPLSCYFWFESPLSIITVSFEFQSSPPSHCYIMQSFPPRQANGASARLPRRAIPALFSF